MREQDKQMLADHYLDLYRMAYNVLRNETDTEDVVQEALAITMSHSFLAKPYSYCVRTLYNQCYRLLSKRDYILPDELPDVAQEEDEGVDEYRVQQLYELKKQLPPRVAKILDLYYVNGLTQAQIAQRQGISEPLVKKLFYKGHEWLRMKMIELDKNRNKTINNE